MVTASIERVADAMENSGVGGAVVLAGAGGGGAFAYGEAKRRFVTTDQQELMADAGAIALGLPAGFAVLGGGGGLAALLAVVLFGAAIKAVLDVIDRAQAGQAQMPRGRRRALAA